VGKDSYYLKHDTNAAHDPKVESMLLRWGMAGYGRYWRLIEILREQSDSRIPRGKWGLSTLAKVWGCTDQDADEYLESLISTFELVKCDGESVWSERLCRDMAAMNRRRDEAKRSADVRWNRERIQNTSERNANAQENDANAMRTQSNSMLEEKRREEQLNEEQSSKEHGASPPAAAPFVSLLKNSLASAGILISQGDFDACASKLIASSADCQECVDFAVALALKGRQPSTWFVKGLLAWDYVGKWRAGKGAVASKAKQQPPPPTLDAMRAERESASPEEETAAAVKAAQWKRDHHMGLTAEEAKLLAPEDTFEDDPLPGVPT